MSSTAGAATDGPHVSAYRRPRAWPPTRRQVLMVAVALGCATLWGAFALFASEVVERETGAMDQWVRSWVAAHRSAAGTAFFGAVTWLGATVVLIPVTLLVAWLVARRTARRPALVIGLAPLALGVTIILLKRGFGLARPDSVAAATLGFSFPSGHTSAGTATAILLSWALVREGLAPRALLAVGVALPLLVGLSRVYLDVHWASDVLGGWVVGGAFGAATCLLYEWARPGRRADRSARSADVAPGTDAPPA